MSAAEAAKWTARIAMQSNTFTLRSRDASTAAFDPTAASAVSEAYTDHADLPCLAPKAVAPEIVEQSGGLVLINDLALYVIADDLPESVTPTVGDRVLFASEVYEVLLPQLMCRRVVWRLILRRVG